MGRLVDDAVVVLESIHRHRKKGLEPIEAALQGTRAVALPVLASTLTTMAVLLPVLLFAGLAQGCSCRSRSPSRSRWRRPTSSASP